MSLLHIFFDILSFFNATAEEAKSFTEYEKLQKQELQNQLDLLNKVITNDVYIVKHKAWRKAMKNVQSVGGKYITN